MTKLEVKYIVLVVLYVFLCLYLGLQYLNGIQTAQLDDIKNSAKSHQYKHLKDLSVEIEKNYKLMEKYKRLKAKIKILKQEVQKQTSRPSLDVPIPPVPQELPKPTILQIPVDPPRKEAPLPPTPTQVVAPQTHVESSPSAHYVKHTEIPVHHDDTKYIDIDLDVHTQVDGENVIPILIFTHDRAEYLEKTLNTIFKYMPSEGFAVFVSQDGGMPQVTQKIQSYGNKLIHLQHPREFIVPADKKQFALYHAIAQHYKWALEKIFSNPKFNRVIILEEDIEVAPDFFDYFLTLSPLMDKDKSILCISCWNDNGQDTHVKDPNVLYRSDFFPGLGWMMSREIWNEMKSKWPLGFWDDWLRQPEQRRDRACIFPEVSRTYTFGSKGVSGGQFFDTHLRTMKLNDQMIPWRSKDVSYLVKERYDPYFDKMVNDAILLKDFGEIGQYQDKDLKMYYNTLSEYMNFARQFNLMGDLKKGVPRGAYKGVVVFRQGTNRIFLVPTRPNLTYETQ